MARKVALYKIPEVLEEAEILDGSLLEPYNDSLKSLNPRAQEVLGRFKIINGELAGSGPLMFVRLQNSGVLPAGTRLAERKDLQTAIDRYAEENNGKNFTADIYTDLGFALRTAGDSYEVNGIKVNDALAKKLVGQLQGRGIALNEGVLIPFLALRDSEDTDSYYGLTLDFNDLATNESVRDLRDFKWDYKRNEGLACACRSGRNWNSGHGGLGRSDDGGRMVIVRAVGTPQKILEQKVSDYRSQVEQLKAQYLDGLKQLRDKITAEIG